MPEIEDPSLNETLDNVFGLLRRRLWWIMVPACCVALATIGYALRLPDRYRSEAMLVFESQRVSQRYVAPTTDTPTTDIVQSVTREVLSRSHLLGIINEFNLYSKDRERLTPETLADRMRDDDVGIESLDQVPGRQAIPFNITFTAETPQLAQAVTSRLTTLFITENIRTRGQQATSTTTFLTSQLEEAQKKLTEQEQRLREFMTRNTGELPEQQQANVATLQGLQAQLQTTATRLIQARAQRAMLESTITTNLKSLEADRSALLARYTEQFSAVIKKTQELKRMQGLLERLEKGPSGSNGLQEASIPDDPSVAQLRNQVDANATETSGLSDEEQRLEKAINQVQNRLNLTPVISQQLSAIQRDYDLYKKAYTDLQASQIQAQLTANVEESQDGQQFRVIDPATLPAKASAPKRMKICAGGAAAGLVLGLVLAFLREKQDRSFHGEGELKRVFPVPIVLGLPLLLTLTEERGGVWRRAFVWTAASAATLVVLAAEFYVYHHG